MTPTNLLKDLNARTDEMRYRVARQTITIVKTRLQTISPLQKLPACLSEHLHRVFCKYLHERRNADVFSYSYKDGANRSDSILRAIRSGNYDEVVVSVNGYSLRPAS